MTIVPTLRTQIHDVFPEHDNVSFHRERKLFYVGDHDYNHDLRHRIVFFHDENLHYHIQEKHHVFEFAKLGSMKDTHLAAHLCLVEGEL